MTNRPQDTTGKPAASTDTSSYEQQHVPDANVEENRRYDKAPHERDESAQSTGNRLDQPVPPSKRQISQAHDDIESGQVDTDRRGVPDDVPGSRSS